MVTMCGRMTKVYRSVAVQRADRHWRARGSGPPATGLSLCTEAAVPCRVEFRLKAERRTVPPSSGTAITVLSRWNE